MAAGKINLQKASGGITAITSVDGASNTNLVLPASGNIASVDTAVTDNAIARYDSTTGKLQNSGVIIDDNGNVGVGTSSPKDKIHSTGGIITTGSYSGISNGGSTIMGYNGGIGYVYALDPTIAWKPMELGALSFDIKTSGTSRVIVDSAGNVGIGSFPIAKLSTLGANNCIAENVFVAGILGVTNGFTVSKDSVSNPNYTFQTTNGAIGLEINSSGMVLLKAGTGALGYGTGAGGTVTQLTSKSTAVTLNKPTGTIIMDNSALAAGTSTIFAVNNNLCGINDALYVQIIGPSSSSSAYYRVSSVTGSPGTAYISVTNVTSGSLSEALVLQIMIIKGANS